MFKGIMRFALIVLALLFLYLGMNQTVNVLKNMRNVKYEKIELIQISEDVKVEEIMEEINELANKGQRYVLLMFLFSFASFAGVFFID